MPVDRRIRYEVLPNEEENPPNTEEEVMPAQLVAVRPLPQVTENIPDVQEGAEGSQEEFKVCVQPNFCPPDYNTATDLPTYEEAERTKKEEADQQQQRDEEQGLPQMNVHEFEENLTEDQLGTDGIFVCCLVVAFLFNWVGLMASLCISTTLAARFGALAGFGLSMVKWVAIVKQSQWGNGLAADPWLWWLLIVLGFMIFMKGCLQYLRFKVQFRNRRVIRANMYWFW